MRKKSHISLARHMIDRLDDEGLKKHKLSFCVGSILPDIKPSFLYRKHEINGTFPLIQKRIERLSEGKKAVKKNGRKYYMDLGQVSHYLADYFTFPHNEIYPGGLKDHCSYEERLKHDLKSYIKSGKAANQNVEKEHFYDSGAVCSFIQQKHEDYIPGKHDVADDIHHIVEVNHKALEGIIKLLAERRAVRFRHS